MMLLASFSFVACGGEDDEVGGVGGGTKIDVVGTWYGSVRTDRTGNLREMTVTFYSDKTGRMEYQSSVYYRIAYFDYKISGTTINCKGVIAGEDGESHDDWTQDFEFHSSYIKPINAYSEFTLYKNGENYSEQTSDNVKIDFDYTINWRNNWPSEYKNGVFEHNILVDIAVPAGTQNKGITEFGLVVYTPDGTITNKKGESVYINGKSMKKVFSGIIPNNSAQEWEPFIYIESTSKSIKLEYTIFYWNHNTNNYVYGDFTNTYIYTPATVIDNTTQEENGEPEALEPSEIDEPSKASGSIQGHEYVDLGLSVKWATCNIGANSPEEYGLFFAWGETTGYTAETHEFTRDNYMWYNDATYNTSIFNNNILSSSYDAAYVNWGTSWRMPTRNEFEQLLNKCTWTNTMQNGVSGFLVKGPNGNSIFLPEGGRHKQTLEYEGTCGDYWTSTYYLANKTGDRAYHVFSFSSSTNRDSGVTYRYYGLNIRPVTK